MAALGARDGVRETVNMPGTNAVSSTPTQALSGSGVDAIRPGLHLVTAMLVVSSGAYSVIVWQARNNGDRAELAMALFGLAVFSLAYIGAVAIDRAPRRTPVWVALLIVEVLCILAAYASIRVGPIPALLGVVVGQMAFRWTLRHLIAPILAINAALFLINASYFPAANSWVPVMLYGSMQVFTLILIQALRRGELARAELVETHGTVLAMQRLLEETVRDRERLRIARDLHDVMGHKLTALQINVQVLQQQAPASSGSMELQRVAALSQELLADTRSLVKQLGITDGIAMTDALRALTLAFPSSVVEVKVEEGVHVPHGELAQLLLRVAQEGISNALRHGRAQRVRVELQHRGATLELRVLDDGEGVAAGTTPGFGLQQLRERLEEHGGSLILSNRSRRGAELLAQLPIASEDA
jgi:signal transduction histidine kinase